MGAQRREVTVFELGLDDLIARNTREVADKPREVMAGNLASATSTGRVGD
jgi:hypothetical protein